ncbi:hypothetical protein TrLO_g8910 [Triparma laevis f. longispina]|uniref:Uncharacterized protein n=1 Tax=Triparma laevis f. longispina TaxID=1714387 RepID=A0A9W7E3E9_9STRA|nr:hypothetical protein TrLO_g8910 [Triparma laevis f. longispina]
MISYDWDTNPAKQIAKWGDELVRPWTLKNWEKLENERPAGGSSNKKTMGRIEKRSGSVSVRELLGGVEDK